MSERLSSRQKEQVKQRALDCCEYCWSQEAYSPDTFSVEHITPRAKGGRNACQGCNNRKFVSTEALDPLTGEMVPLYHPRRDHWSEHFVWDEDYTIIIGLTPTGRATVEKLELNRKGVVNLRRLLHEQGLHPVEHAM
jgi:hypothetical protein